MKVFAVTLLSSRTVQAFTMPSFITSNKIGYKTSAVAPKCPNVWESEIFSKDDDNAWDFDEDYEEEKKPTISKNLDGSPNLGINIGQQLEPLSDAQAAALKDEATDTINAAFDDRISDIANLKDQVKKDFEKSKETMRFASDLRAAEQTENLMNKIDKLSSDFLEKNAELRSGTKLAASADRNMAGQGLEVGSWGRVAGMNVLTTAGGGMGFGLLGSVSAAEIEERQKASIESSIEVDTQVKGEDENRIMIVCDDKVSQNDLGIEN